MNPWDSVPSDPASVQKPWDAVPSDNALQAQSSASKPWDTVPSDKDIPEWDRVPSDHNIKPWDAVPSDNANGVLDLAANSFKTFGHDVVQGINAAAAQPWKLMANASDLVQKTGLVDTSGFSDYARGQQNALTPKDEPSGLASMVTRGLTEGTVSLPTYVSAYAAGGIPALAAMGALSESDKGMMASAKGAIDNAIMGGMAKAVSPLTRSAQAAVLGGTGFTGAALQGGDLEQSLASGITNAGLSMTSPGGTMKLSEAAKDFRRSVENNAGNDPYLKALNAVVRSAAPMATGTEESSAIVKQAANDMRWAEYQNNKIFDDITRDFKPEEWSAMARAQAEESLMRNTGIQEPGKGWDSLNPKQREAIDMVQKNYERVVGPAMDMGILKDPMDVYDPRRLIEILDDGTIRKISSMGSGKSLGGIGSNVQTALNNLKQRKYITTEDTEAAARKIFGDNVSVLQDIRVNLLVNKQLEKIVVGKQLINQIKKYESDFGTEALSVGHQPEGWIKVEHPAFYERRIRPNEVDGKIVPLKDVNGNVVTDRVPIYASPDFAGPLSAFMRSNDPAALYNLSMAAKSKTMSLVMFSPVVHNATIYWKAAPFDPWNVLTTSGYFKGNELRKDPSFMERSIKNGVVYMDQQRGAIRDITDTSGERSLEVGQSLTAKAAGLLAKPFGKEMQAKRAIDKAGDFWHGDLLWRRVADLQAYVYNKVESDLMNLGLPQEAAGKAAGHIANRYGGAIPYEDMGEGMRKSLNLLLFSRSFTGTNAGIYKDTVFGLPKPIRGQLKQLTDTYHTEIANNYLKQKQFKALVADIGMNLILSAGLASTIQYFRNNHDLDEIVKGYGRRLARWAEQAGKNPLMFLNPVGSIEAASPTSENEPGKEHRVLSGTTASGTGIYLKNPIGKIGEDLLDMFENPLDLTRRKGSPMAKFALGVLSNDKGFGRKVYDNLSEDNLKMVGNVLGYFVETHTPYGFIEGVRDIATGADPHNVSLLKTVGAPLGFSFSKGSPGGPESGLVYNERKKHENNKREALMDARRYMNQGKSQEAIDAMLSADMSPSEIRRALSMQDSPYISKRSYMEFYKSAEPKDIYNLEHLNK